MVQFEGTFKLQSQDNYKGYLISMGLNEDEANQLSDKQATMIVKDVKSDKVTIEFGGQGTTFPLNKAFENTVAIHHKVWTTVTLNDDGITFKSKVTEDGLLSEEKVFTITDSELISTSSNSKGIKAVRRYKRVIT